MKCKLGLEIGVVTETLHPHSLLKAVLRPHDTTPYDITEVISTYYRNLTLGVTTLHGKKKWTVGPWKTWLYFRFCVKHILYVKFLLCCICIVNSVLDVDMAFNCVLYGAQKCLKPALQYRYCCNLGARNGGDNTNTVLSLNFSQVTLPLIHTCNGSNRNDFFFWLLKCIVHTLGLEWRMTGAVKLHVWTTVLSAVLQSCCCCCCCCCCCFKVLISRSLIWLKFLWLFC